MPAPKRTMPAAQVSREQYDLLLDLEQGRHSVEYFAEHILCVKINPAQRRWFRYIDPDEDGWTWRYKTVAHVAANQIGKSLGLAIIILWACFYKIGVDTADSEAWFTRDYNWFHVAPLQSQAYIPLDDALKLIHGEHAAQVGKVRLPKGLIVEGKADVYYRSLEFFNGAVAQFRTTDDKAKALQGKRAAGISGDECGFEMHLTEVVNETLMMRLVSTGGPLFLVSTPNGINDWYEFVHAIIDNAAPRELAEGDLIGGWVKEGDLLPCWIDHATRSVVCWSAIEDNVGYGIPESEWQRMEQTLDPRTKEQQLRGAFLEPAEAFFVPSEIAERAFSKKLPASQLPLPNHLYAISWDLSGTSDPTVVIVLDITGPTWYGVHFERWEKPLDNSTYILKMYELHALYNGGSTKVPRGQAPPRAVTAFDASSMGGALVKQALASLAPKRPINFGGPKVKADLLSNLRAAVMSRKVVIPKSWTRVHREVLTYQMPDDGITQDCVMSLAMAADVAAKGFTGVSTHTFRVTH